MKKQKPNSKRKTKKLLVKNRPKKQLTKSQLKRKEKTNNKYKNKKVLFNRRPLEFVRYLKNIEANFEAVYTNYSAIIKWKGKTYSFLKSKNRDSFYLASKIKKEINECNLYVDKIVSDKIKYFHVNGLSVCSHKKVHCVDINGAYPNALHNMGFISKKLLTEMMDKSIDKITRLKAIGQIATRKTKYNYVKGVCGAPEIICNDYLRNVWFALCYEVGEVIEKCKRALIAKKDYLFFWFDGVYFKNKKNAAAVVSILKKAGYECKIETLTNFVVKKQNDNLMINYFKGDKQKPKTFILPMVEKSYYH